MKKIATAAALLCLSQGALATDYIIPDNTLVCDTEKTYRNQIQYLVDGHRSVISGCEITVGDTPVILVDAALSGPSKVEVKLTGKTLWTDTQFIQSR